MTVFVQKARYAGLSSRFWHNGDQGAIAGVPIKSPDKDVDKNLKSLFNVENSEIVFTQKISSCGLNRRAIDFFCDDGSCMLGEYL